MNGLKISGMTAAVLANLDDTAKIEATDNTSSTVAVTIAQLKNAIAVQNIWTPSIGGTATYTTQAGRYTKIGKLVVAYCDVQINAMGTGSTTALSGLPFVSANNAMSQAGTVWYFASLPLSLVYLSCYVAPSSSTLTFTGLTAAAATINNTVAVFGAGAHIALTIIYEATV